MSVLPCGILLSSYQAKHEWLTHLLLLSHKAVSNSLPPCGLQPDFPVPHNLPKFARVHVHWVSDTIQPLLPSSPHAFSLSQHQGPFQWVGSLYQVAKVLELQLQDWFYQWVFSIDFLQHWLGWSPCSPTDSQESSPTPQFESISSLVLSHSYGTTLTSIHDYWKDHSFVGKVMSLLFNTLSRFIIAFLPRRKYLLISWLQSPSTVILKP